MSTVDYMCFTKRSVAIPSWPLSFSIHFFEPVERFATLVCRWLPQVAPSAYYVPDPLVDWGRQYFSDFDWAMARQEVGRQGKSSVAADLSLQLQGPVAGLQPSNISCAGL